MMPSGPSSDSFCAGSGRVMLPGFQTAHSSADPCVLFLFQSWALDTPVKYAFGVLGACAMGVANEMLARARSKVAQRLSEPRKAAKPCCAPGPALIESHPLSCRLLLGGLYGLQMVWAYWMMLLVMLYESCIFSALVLGLACGHALFSASFASMLDGAKSAQAKGAREAKAHKQRMGNGGANVTDQAAAAGATADQANYQSLAVEDGDNALNIEQDTQEETLRPINVQANAPCCGGTK